MKKREFINEDALSLWDAMTSDEKSMVRGGTTLMSDDAEVPDQVTISWSKDI